MGTPGEGLYQSCEKNSKILDFEFLANLVVFRLTW